MRLASLLVTFLAVAACEDGPPQTFRPLPAGVDPNGGTGSYADPARHGFFTPRPLPTGAACSDAERANRRDSASQSPILPGTSAEGIDMSGGPAWKGTTIEAVIVLLCEPDEIDEAGYADWGDFYVTFDPKSRKVASIDISSTRSAVHAKSRTGGRFGDHTYEIPPGRQLQRDGQAMVLDWNAPRSPNDWRNELYDAVAATFSALPADVDCNASRRCVAGNFGSVAYLYMPAIGLSFWVDDTTDPQRASTPHRLDITLVRTFAFANAPALMKLDPEGPTLHAGVLGARTPPCTLTMGMTFGDFVSACVEVTGDTTKDQVERAKLLGNRAHDAERFHLDLGGPLAAFHSNGLAADAVLDDTSVPSNGDTLRALWFGQNWSAPLVNDYTNNDASQPPDEHGAGLVYLEYAHLVQDALNRLTGGMRTLGDAACNAAGATDGQLRAAGCTGFEGMVTSAPPSLVPDPTMRRLAIGTSARRFGAGGLRAGHHSVAFCNDATGSSTDYVLCADKGDTFVTSLARVTKILGRGNVASLPREARDTRFYFALWFEALVKYLGVAGDPAQGIDAVHGRAVRRSDFVFTPPPASTRFDTASYVDRSAIAGGVAPTRLSFTADLANGIMLGYDFTRDLLRGESALYTSMIDHRVADDPPAKQDTARLTNVFGSPALLSGWSDHAPFTAHYCATHLDAASCGEETAPVDGQGAMLLDERGQPILAPYEGAFTKNATQWSLSIATDAPTPISLVVSQPNIASSMIELRLNANPYDLASPPAPQGDHLRVLLPAETAAPTVGFPIAVSGTRDRFVSASRLALTGTTLAANVYWRYPAVPRNTPTPIQLIAVESSDFFGDVFVCRDAGGDLLRAKMSTAIADLLDWLAAHPGAYQRCQIVVHYSGYGTSVDAITSIANGVRVDVAPGTSRVGRATLFAPGL